LLEQQTKRNLAETIKCKETELKLRQDAADYRTSQLVLQQSNQARRVAEAEALLTAK
jgi:hypothetical protein